MIFTAQRNFEHAHASDSEGWDNDTASMEGASFLALPRWPHGFTANIAYHHIHHLSVRLPNYHLAECHERRQGLFAGVRRIRLSEIHEAMKCILWDNRARRIISVVECRQM